MLGQVLQGARLLPRDAQAPAMAGGTTAFLEAWMEHILEHRIRFRYRVRGTGGLPVVPPAPGPC